MSQEAYETLEQLLRDAWEYQNYPEVEYLTREMLAIKKDDRTAHACASAQYLMHNDRPALRTLDVCALNPDVMLLRLMIMARLEQYDEGILLATSNMGLLNPTSLILLARFYKKSHEIQRAAELYMQSITQEFSLTCALELIGLEALPNRTVKEMMATVAWPPGLEPMIHLLSAYRGCLLYEPTSPVSAPTYPDACLACSPLTTPMINTNTCLVAKAIFNMERRNLNQTVNLCSKVIQKDPSHIKAASLLLIAGILTGNKYALASGYTDIRDVLDNENILKLYRTVLDRMHGSHVDIRGTLPSVQSTDVDVILAAALITDFLGYHSTSANYYWRLNHLKKSSSISRILLAINLRSNGFMSDSDRILEETISEFSDDPWALHEYAVNSVLRKKYTAAREIANQASKLCEDWDTALYTAINRLLGYIKRRESIPPSPQEVVSMVSEKLEREYLELPKRQPSQRTPLDKNLKESIKTKFNKYTPMRVTKIVVS